MNGTELFKHTKYVKQLKSDKTGVWSFKVFIPYTKGSRNLIFTKTFSSNKYSSSREAFDAAVDCRDKFLVDLKTIGIPESTTMTVLDTLEKSFEMSSLSSETIRKKRITFKKWTSQNIYDKVINEINAADVQMSLAEASRETKISQGILDDLYCIWNQIFKTAMRMDVIYRNPFDKVDRLKIKNVQPEHRIAETDLKTLLQVCNAIMHHTENSPRTKYNSEIVVYALKLSWFTALRPAEVLALERKHISEINKVLYVRQEVGLNKERKPYIRSPKSERSYRNIPLTNEALVFLEEIKKYQKDKKYLFADFDGNLMDSTYTANKITRACKKEGIQFNWYCLRHQYSTDMQRNREALSVTAKGMGHENINMTYQYSRMSDEDLRNAMVRLGRTLKQNI